MNTQDSDNYNPTLLVQSQGGVSVYNNTQVASKASSEAT